ncbi:FORMS APLOID AND BINUCLEATE CELLS 1C isoform X2 [Wolffia australiana]
MGVTKGRSALGLLGNSGMSGLFLCQLCHGLFSSPLVVRCRACSLILCAQCMSPAPSSACKLCLRSLVSDAEVKDGRERAHSLASPHDQLSPPSLHCSIRSYDDDDDDDDDDCNDNGEGPEKSLRSPCSLFSQDASDVDSSGCSAGNEFYSFKCQSPSPLDSPDSVHEPLDDFRPSETVKGEEKLTHLAGKDLADLKLFDIENDGRLWLPPPPQDEGDDAESNYFVCDDDEDGGSLFGCIQPSVRPCGGSGNNDGGPDDEDEDEDDDGNDDGNCSFSMRERSHDVQKELLRTSAYGHFRALVCQLLRGEDIPSGIRDGEDGWLDVVSSLAWQAASFVRPDTTRGASMDPADYVKVKCIPSGRPRESLLVKGVVCTKNVKHKRMISQHKNPRLLLLAGALEYQKVSSKLASLENILQQEIDHLKMAVAKIESLRPNVLLVEKSVSSYAQEYLLAKEISLVLNVKRPLLERIARCTGARILPSVDAIASSRLGHCEIFRVERTSEEGLAGNLPCKKPCKTLMFFEGCPRHRGCTVLLKGPNLEELKKMKNIVLYASFAAYHLSLETSYLADSGAALPKSPPNLQICRPAADSASVALNSPAGTFPASAWAQKGGLCPSVSSLEQAAGIPEDIHDFYRDKKPQVNKGEVQEEGALGSPSGDHATAPESHQSILVSLSSSCVSRGIICERSKLLRIKFYGNSDKPLGRYLRDDLFDQTFVCRCCGEPPETHVRCFIHQHGSLTISIKRLMSAKLPGESDGRIWMWHRCLRCDHQDGVPPATRRVVMSDAAWGLSFGKFLELSFSNQTIANRVASCGHSLQKDCLRFFGFGNMVAFIHYSPVNILSVHLPSSVLKFASQRHQEWFKREAGQIAMKVDLLFGEVLDVLNGIEHKIVTYVDQASKGSLRNLLTELKDLAQNERHKYDIFLRSANQESSVLDHQSSDILELNQLKRALLIDSYVWDRRIYLLDSKVNSSSSEINVHLLEVSVHNGLVQRSGSFPVNRRFEFSPLASPKESDTVDLLCNEDERSATTEKSPISSSPRSSLTDRIDSAWAGSSKSLNGSPLADVNDHRNTTMAPVRVYSFDSSLSVRPRLGDFISDPVSSSFQRAYSHHSTGGIENLKFLFGRLPLHISSTGKMVRDGARLLLPQTGPHNVVIAVYDKEPSSVIAYALSSKDYLDFISCSSDSGEKDQIKDLWNLSLEDVQNGGNIYLDSKQPHFKFSFVDESSIPAERARFAVTCYFAKEFDDLRKKCCPNMLDFIRSLSRCRQWDAQGGKSNVYFAKSMDERFIIKQVTRTELESFEDFAPQYFKYMMESITSGSPTCLAKILGVYQVGIKSLKGGREVRMDLMVIENLLFGRNISRVYDLKGSSRSRYNADGKGRNKVMLDLNLVESLRSDPIFLGSKAKRSLERAIWNDTSFLAMVHVMDYSLLVGIDQEKKELVIGIIDFLRQYTWDKHLETWVKASGILGGPTNASPTIISPKQYKKRFRKAMCSYFLTVPDQWLP